MFLFIKFLYICIIDFLLYIRNYKNNIFILKLLQFDKINNIDIWIDENISEYDISMKNNIYVNMILFKNDIDAPKHNYILHINKKKILILN